MAYNNHKWPAEAVDILKAGWSEGLSASQISCRLRALGHRYTRNSVIGKTHRLGLPKRAQPMLGCKPPKPRRARTYTYPRPRKPAAQSLNEAYIEAVEALAPIDPGLGIMGLNRFTCRYPIGDPALPGFAFCGRTCGEEDAYCTSHSRIAYRAAKPPPPRHRDRVRPVWREGWEVAA